MKRPASFKQTDIVRALKAAKDGGLTITRIEIETTGKIVLMAGQGPAVVNRDSWGDVV